MTPKTQSVCKHCPHLESEHFNISRFDGVDDRCKFCDCESFTRAEPASTGEPELSKAEARQLAAGLIDYAEGRVQSLDEIEREIGIEECEGGLAIGAKAEQGIVGTQPLSPIKSSLRNEHSSINLVARPPEPSAPQANLMHRSFDYQGETLASKRPAPQTSAEPMSDAHMYLKARAAVRKANEPAAPQPVSGDAPKYILCGNCSISNFIVTHSDLGLILKCNQCREQKLIELGDALKVEEIRPRCPNCGRWNVCLRRDFDDRLYVTCGACNFEVPLNMGTIECLSPFFLLTSTVRSSPDSHLGAVRD